MCMRTWTNKTREKLRQTFANKPNTVNSEFIGIPEKHQLTAPSYTEFVMSTLMIMRGYPLQQQKREEEKENETSGTKFNARIIRKQIEIFVITLT